MKVTLFTSNQPRHVSLAKTLSNVCDEVYCIQECTTISPGEVMDFYKKSEVMQRYFSQVLAAENKLFGDIAFTNKNVRTLSIKSGDLNFIKKDTLSEALDSDVYIIFGSSYIKGWLIDFLVDKMAINIHMGLSPYYRGSSCNFWALYDYKPEYVGATIHKLSRGLDSGPMLYHCLPIYKGENPFEFTMKSVVVAHESLIARIADGSIFKYKAFQQDKSLEVRYSRNEEFTDTVAEEFLQRDTDLSKVFTDNEPGKYPPLVKPYFG